MIRFFVSGIPKTMSVGKGVRVPNKAGGWNQFQTRRNSEWGLVVGQVGREHAPAAPLTYPVSFTATFYVPRPSSAKKTERLPTKRPDVDGLVHKLTDQFNGVFWVDDSQITDFVVRKRFAVDGRPGVEIIVAPVLVDAPARACRCRVSWRRPR